ncbi:tryptophan--tRNA ligase [Serpentinicella sp. ANB-PHB4]|uniref:tryptophan--tRNA ligase n=1 Tax=Serpentinicella sp. ANB-PHB4 TaxID=3074076 RepID=UPI0028614B85|nr:tryptophan--tRNA ligase [Serpentinicella sp. ANB-PHB4]MDR5658704.1 tryptophan--tRNA ligase [Serpentinicella sp. ANB-PHB4]
MTTDKRENNKQKVIFSGAQPTGSLTLGNYIGAIQNWKALEDQYECYYSIVDLHSLTIRHDPKAFRKSNLSFLAQFLASGLNPKKNVIFFQSHVPQHAELGWILNCNAYLGELNRMTQFKEKSETHKDNINAGLFTYPVLQAADILLYKTNLVPVGEDQKQHLELSRDIAIRFNNTYGKVFEVPEIHMTKVGGRIMSLQDPTKKMSKSDEDANGTIFLLDDDKVIIKKLKRAVTDSENKVNFRDEQPGIKNLMTIHSKLSGMSMEQIENEYEGKGYGAFKNDIGEMIVEYIQPFKEKYNEYMTNEDYLEAIYKQGAERAREKAEATMKVVRKKLGLVKF